MIPARPAAPPPRSKESISDKISRLRREDHAASRPRLHHAPPQASSSAPRWLAAATDDRPPPSRRPRTSDPRRGTAGPAPPPSWTSPASASTDLSSSSTSSSSHDPRRRTPLRPRDLVERRKLVEPLVAVAPSSSASRRPSVDSLFALAGGVLAADLSRARAPPAHSSSSLLLDHVAYLPNHVRVRLVNDVFADWRNPAPLTDEGARELLRTDVNDGVDVGVDADGEDVEGPLGRLRIDEGDDERGGWEDDALAAQDAHLVELVDVLDLSFAHVSLRTLRSLLLRPVGPAPLPPPPSAPSQPRPPLAAPSPALAPPLKLVSAFPHLHTLTLAATPRLALADPLFDLLAHLVSLRHLSLAGKHLDGHHPSSPSVTSSSATAASLLPRLAAATPTLRTLDLSYLAGLVVDALPAAQGLVGVVRGVDWDARWGELRVLGVRGAVEEREGEEEGEEEGNVREERACVRREVREVVMLGRQRKKRRWIDVVV